MKLPDSKKIGRYILIFIILLCLTALSYQFIYKAYFTDRSYTPGKLHIYFKENVTEEEALSIIEFFNCSLDDEYDMDRYEDGVLFAFIKVPIGEEKELRDKFNANPAVLRCELLWIDG